MSLVFFLNKELKQLIQVQHSKETFKVPMTKKYKKEKTGNLFSLNRY